MKNKGFTLLELMVAIAILSILVLMISQIANSTSQAHRKQVVINELEKTLGKSIELIKRTARMAQEAENDYNLPADFAVASSRLPIIIKDGNNNENESTSVIMNYSEEIGISDYRDNQIMYFYDSGTKTLRVKTRIGGSADWVPANGDIIAENVDEAIFMYDESVLRIKITVNVNKSGLPEEEWKKKTVADAAVIRTIVRGAN